MQRDGKITDAVMKSVKNEKAGRVHATQVKHTARDSFVKSRQFSLSSFDSGPQSSSLSNSSNDEAPSSGLAGLERRASLSTYASELDSESSNLSIIPKHFFCPIGKDLMTQPVTASNGVTYDKSCLLRMLANASVTGKDPEVMNITSWVANKQLEHEIDVWIEENATNDPNRASSESGSRRKGLISMGSWTSTMTPSVYSYDSEEQVLGINLRYLKIGGASFVLTLLLIGTICVSLALAGVFKSNTASGPNVTVEPGNDKIPSPKTENEDKSYMNVNSSYMERCKSAESIECDESTNILMEICLQTDFHPFETSWNLKRLADGTLAASSELGKSVGDHYEAETLYRKQECLPLGSTDTCYEFFITDSGGDGLCCNLGGGDGFYLLTINGDQVLQGGDFGMQESYVFGGPSCD